jgi:Ca2+-binding RTX toxin-like protein
MVTLIRSDLQFILDQIKISEAHAAGTPLTDLIPSAVLPWGLRTVDGSYNNLVPGQSQFGTGDEPFPRLTQPVYRDAEVAPFDPDGPGLLQPGDTTSYTQSSGVVVDSTPRLISNLIADQSSDNPAAADAAGYDGTDFVKNLSIPNVAPDVGLSAPFNSWMTLFGQFFDHGLDLVTKGGNGAVYIPLRPDDEHYKEGGDANFMIVTRATRLPGPDGVIGTSDDEHNNKTTPFIDQNQTYTSHASHQVFLREYELDASGKPVSTGALLDGAEGGLATWADVKVQAAEKLGIRLTDTDVLNVPLLATDAYGQFERGPNGYVQILKTVNGATVKVEGNPSAPVDTTGALRTGHSFLDDIAHTADPTKAGYDDGLLDRHFISGDGRGNENIGLTAVHTVFHAEHNRLVEHVKSVVLGAADLDFLNEWLLVDVGALPGTTQGLVWDGERLFQAARFVTEMQYQHLVFEEFARKINPMVDVFVAPFGYEQDINPAIVAEFAHVVYRFGHSMLTETVDRYTPDFASDDHMALVDAFLNPDAFNSVNGGPVDAREAVGAIVRGMTRQVGNEIDEFVTGALRSNLLGLPLDLVAINIARGRDTGVPSLNEVRREFYKMSGNDSQLKPYVSWADFALNIQHELSIVNFIAAYGTHQSILDADTVEEKRAAAWALIVGGDGAPGDRLDFLNSTGGYADVGGKTVTGVDNIDFWIGGLAEKKMAFGSMLGSTFNFVFENQMEALQNGDRFYYLARLDGLNLFHQLEQNSFADLIMRHSDAEHLPADVFSRPDFFLEVTRAKQFNEGLGSADPTGGGLINPLVMRNKPGEYAQYDNYLRFTGDQHVVLGGTNSRDVLIAGAGDDTVYGDGGNDRIEGGFGNDHLFGGAGNDIITDAGGDDVIHGGDGHDVIHGGNGINLLIGGAGNDFIVTGEDVSEVFGGLGNDFILGAITNGGMQGNEGNDWIEVGAQDGAVGDNFSAFGLDDIEGHDVFLGSGGFDEYVGEGGDDIMVGSYGVNRNEGMSGFDWVTYKDLPSVRADLSLPAFDETPVPPSQDTAIDRYAFVEGLSGSHGNDLLFGDNQTAATLAVAGARGSVLRNISLINGLAGLLPQGATSFDGGNIILGGGGSDDITGRGGDDIIDGDKWLNVRISVRTNPNDPATEVKTATSMRQLVDDMVKGTYHPGQLVIVREILDGNKAGDVDTAVYSGLRGEYDITQNANGSWRVAHTGGTQADGTDTLWNIERIRFGDGGILSLVPVGPDPDPQPGAAPTTATIRTPADNNDWPTEGQALTATPASSTVSNIRWQWQVLLAGVWTSITGATADAFTPTQEQVGQQLRVQIRYTEDGGEKVAHSAPTNVVGDLYTGTGGNDVFNGTPGRDVADGGGGNDILNGGLGPDILRGGVGNDQLNGGEGDDLLEGGAGADRLDGGAGVDWMIGGTGDDVYIVDNALDVVQEAAGQGRDRIETTLSTYDLSALGLEDVEDLTFTGTGPFQGTGNALANTIRGGAGNDIIDGRGGADTMIGGAGDDIYFANVAGDVITEAAGGGFDTIKTTANTFTARNNVEVLEFVGTGNATLTGNGAANTMIGGDGNDTLAGLGGNDDLHGGGGNDTLNGGNGADRLTGGVGNDRLTGGGGNDVFVFSANSGADTVTDFDWNPARGQDRLDISALGVTAANFAAMVNFTALPQNGTRITFNNVDPDGLSITLLNTNPGNLDASDFLLA